MEQKNIAKHLVDSFSLPTFVVRTLNISNAIMALFRGSGASLRGFAKHTGQRLFLCPKHNVINTMRTPVNHANEAKNSTLDRTNRAPKWVGVIGFIFLLAVPADFAELDEFFFYVLFNLPVAAFCFYATGGFDFIVDHFKSRK